VSKRKKIIIIAVAVTLALVMGVGGLIFAQDDNHEELGGHKLIGVGEMGYEYYNYTGYEGYQDWDTEFIITNPNCERELKIEWVALIESDEDVVFEGTPDDWDVCWGITIPSELSGHAVWQVSIADDLIQEDPYEWDLEKYTLEVTWSGAYYSWWSGWGRVRPLIGWQKEKTWSQDYYPPAFSISEAEMQLFPSRVGFKPPEWWKPESEWCKV